MKPSLPFELALSEAELLLDGFSVVDRLTDPDTGEIVTITLVTDNGGPSRRSASLR